MISILLKEQETLLMPTTNAKNILDQLILLTERILQFMIINYPSCFYSMQFIFEAWNDPDVHYAVLNWYSEYYKHDTYYVN